MLPIRILPAAILATALLSACATSVSTTGGGGTVTLGSSDDSQLRASVAHDLRRAGISDACIQSLDRQALGQVKAFTAGSAPRTSKDWITERQKTRTFVSRYCPNL